MILKRGGGRDRSRKKKERGGSIAQESKKKHEGSEGVRGLKSRRSSDAADTPPSILWTCSIVRSLQRGSYLRSFIEAGAKKETAVYRNSESNFLPSPVHYASAWFGTWGSCWLTWSNALPQEQWLPQTRWRKAPFVLRSKAAGKITWKAHELHGGAVIPPTAARWWRLTTGLRFQSSTTKTTVQPQLERALFFRLWDGEGLRGQSRHIVFST